MNKPQLIVMAAGMGSRFGGLKQITPVDNHAHPILDYSVFDARRAGFERVICVIKRELERDFHEIVGARLGKQVDLTYAFQDLTDLPAGFSVPENRTRPWGTAHATMSARHLVDAPFAVINADDYLGRDVFKTLYQYMVTRTDDHSHAMIGYPIENTLTDYGSVARGVCQKDENDYLTDVVERVKIFKDPQGAKYTEDGEHFTPIPAGTPVSMNFWGFGLDMMHRISDGFADYLSANLEKNPERCEYFLPYAVDRVIRAGHGTVKVLPTDEKWFGVTYHDDLPHVVRAIADMTARGLYPENLWEDD